jgi:hypothetical protein
MGSLLGRLSERNVVLLGMGIFFLWGVISHPDMEFTYYRSSKPFPNQRFARVVFHVVGVVLIMEGLWGLWIDLHAGR